MKAIKIFFFVLLLLLFSLTGLEAFAGTGGPNDGQIMLLAILVLLSLILGILYFFPLLVVQIRKLWSKFHHC
jgi:quinol-cytochrome oxidoreductase complex cytochrome b subunit